MKDSECVAFLQWCMPRLRMRWQGFRKVRRRVCKRVDRRLRELGLSDVAAYRRHLEEHEEEWAHLDRFCRIPISRFRRDRAVWDGLKEHVLPALAELAVERGQRELWCWSAGCASGEEPYTLRILWDLVLAREYPRLRFTIVATDVEENSVRRALRGVYAPSSLREVPEEWRTRAFDDVDGEFRVRDGFRADVRFLVQDVRTALPDEAFHLVVCRNAVFTYFDEPLQRELALRIATRMVTGGALVLGVHESLPDGVPFLVPWEPVRGAYRLLRPPGTDPPYKSSFKGL